MLGFLIGIVIAVIIIILLCFANVITFKENHNLGIDITGLKFNDTEVKDMVQENIYIGGDGIQSIYKVYSYNVNLYFSGKVKITTIIPWLKIY